MKILSFKSALHSRTSHSRTYSI